MLCPRCHTENREGRRFCSKCGAALALACASCGFTNEPTDEFCGGCGVSLRSSPPTSQSKFSSPQSYTPKHLAEKILTSKAALEGERKQVTVLFADLKGSMELLADRDPEEARNLLDPVIEHMMEAVHRYEGTVNQVMGDGIMALFGAPVAHEDHAVRACYAALRMQEVVRRYGEEVRRSHGIEVQIRVGLNSGEVVVRSIGSDLHMDYTAVGQTTHLAARMEQLATPGSIRLTADTLRLAERYVEVKPLGPVPVKGMVAPVEVYEATGVGTVRSRLQASTARGLTRFVGRDAEIEQLRKALDQARAGRGQLVATVGEPGVGKSRLFHEFTHSHLTEDWLILQSGSVSYGKATSYLPVIDLLKGYFKVSDRETHREIREKVTGKLFTLDRALEPTLPALMALLDVPPEDAQWQALDPPQRRQRTLDAVKRLVLRESQVQPTLVVFEDLHWVDSETQAFLDSLVESLPTARLVLLVNYRPEYQHGWGSKTYYSQLRLDALPPESANELLLALLGTDATVEPLKSVLITRTGGNPLFLEESVRTLVETHALAGQRGAHRLVHPLDTIDMPATVQAILASRIDRLAPKDKQLLQTASVIGKDVPSALLLAIAGLADDDLRLGLVRLQSAEFLYETSLFPEVEYTFKHALTHEVAYGGVLHERRRTLHAGIVEVIETLHSDRVLEYVDRLAHHAFRGEAWEKAVAYLRQAGAKSMARSAYRDATTHLEQALTALAHLPQNRDTLEKVIDLHLEVRNALVGLGEIARTLGHLREAEASARALGDRRRLAWVCIYTAIQLWFTGHFDETIEAGQRAVDIATESDDLPLQGAAQLYLGLGYHARGDYRRAIECLECSVRSLQGDQVYQRSGGFGLPSVNSRAWLVWCLSEIGRFAEALEQAREAVRIAEATNHPASLVFACRSVGLAHLRKGDFDGAIPALERAVEVCRMADLRAPFDVTASFLGYACAFGGRAAEAVPLMERAVIDPAATGSANHALLLAHLAEGRLLAGHLDQGLAVAQRGLDLARRQKERGNEAWVLRLLGDIDVRRDPSDARAAERHYREALARAEELGMRPLVAHCHLGLGKLYRRTHKHEQAREHLATATTMYREMGMTYWLEKAEAELKGHA